MTHIINNQSVCSACGLPQQFMLLYPDCAATNKEFESEASTPVINLEELVSSFVSTPSHVLGDRERTTMAWFLKWYHHKNKIIRNSI